jgi:hypothetical protein
MYVSVQPFVFQLFQEPLQYVLQARYVALYPRTVVFELFTLQLAYNGQGWGYIQKR